jgi:hypothetical protein
VGDEAKEKKHKMPTRRFSMQKGKKKKTKRWRWLRKTTKVTKHACRRKIILKYDAKDEGEYHECTQSRVEERRRECQLSEVDWTRCSGCLHRQMRSMGMSGS